MHSIDYQPPNATPLNQATSPLPYQVQFATQQQAPEERRLNLIFQDRIAAKEYFYGIELAARPYGHLTLLDYSSFGDVLPLFTSLIWLGMDYWNVEPVTNVESIRVAKELRPQTIVMPHFTCYQANEARLGDVMALNFSNVLALRGDNVAPEQEFQHAVQLVQSIRKLRGDNISIGVAGYPGGHPDAESLEQDMEYLQQKIAAGGNFIITQLHFSSAVIKEFVASCRANGITVPILLGVFVPETWPALKQILRVTRVPMAKEERAEYAALKNEPERFQDLAVSKAVAMISDVFDSNLDIYGVQFFTMNRFRSVQRILCQLTPKYFKNSNTLCDRNSASE